MDDKQVEYDSNSSEQAGEVAMMSLAAVCSQSIGAFRSAVAYFSKALLIDQTSCCWYQREVALLVWSSLDRSLRTFCLDDVVDPRIKDGWCKRASWRYIMPSSSSPDPSVERYVPLVQPKTIPSLEDRSPHTAGPTPATHTPSPPPVADCSLIPTEVYPLDPCPFPVTVKLLAITAPLGAWIQLRCVGFLPNLRQHKMFGLASLQMAQSLVQHVSSVKLGGPGLQIPDATSSSTSPSGSDTYGTSTYGSNKSSKAGSSSSGHGGMRSGMRSAAPPTGKRQSNSEHPFYWRDFFDIIVRWRQISEPNDPVWWIDRLPLKAFAGGFSLQTPLVNGQLKTSRYYCYYNDALRRLKEHLKKGFYNAENVLETLSKDKLDKVGKMSTVDDVLKIIGKDFYVVLSCTSLRNPGSILEGTRLTLVNHVPEGVEFTIRTPGFPQRWKLYELEMDSCFQRLVDALSSISDSSALTAHKVKINIGSSSKGSIGSGHEKNKNSINGNSSSSSKSNFNNTLNRTDPGPNSAPHTETTPSPHPADAPSDPSPSPSPLPGLTPRHTDVLKISLELFYLWVNFAPLTRGTATCGYASMLATMLSCGATFSEPLPLNMQLDWEAIFSHSCKEFVDRMVPLLPLTPALSAVDSAPSVEGHISTFRGMIDALI